MTKSTDLTRGSITSKLLKLTLPLVASNFIQTAYSFIDMIWIGKLGNESVVAIGTASFFINMAFALFAIVVTGTGIKISNSFGAKDYNKVEQYTVNGYILSFLLAIIYSVTIILFRDQIIGFFNIEEEIIRTAASKYLLISMLGTIFMFFNSIFSSILTSLGNSKLSFKINSVGFIINVLLDPVLIFGIGGYLKLGINGAAIATIISRIVVFIISIYSGKRLLKSRKISLNINWSLAKEVIILGFPFAVQRVIFTLLGIVIARIITKWGSDGIAVQKIGLQIEALSYMTIGGLYGAVIAFIGQNYGAKNNRRIKKVYNTAITISSMFGLFITMIFLIFPREIFGIFLDDPTVISKGVDYLRIIGLSQIFMSVEIVGMASFNGVGRTRIPATVSLIFTSARIPLIFLLTSWFHLGLNGVWWAISITSIVKGLVLISWFRLHINKKIFLEGETNA